MLPVKVLSVTVTVVALMAPPKSAVLPVKVLLETVAVVAKMAPPKSAVLPVKVLSVTVTVAVLVRIAPPSSALEPSWKVRSDTVIAPELVRIRVVPPPSRIVVAAAAPWRVMVSPARSIVVPMS